MGIEFILRLILISASFIALLVIVWIIFTYIKKNMLGIGVDQTPTGLTESVIKEKRQYERVEIRWPVTIESSHGSITGETKDISLGGIFIICQTPLPLGESFSLTLHIPDKEPLTITAEVVWSNINVPDSQIVTRGMGIRFIKISEEARKRLTDGIEHHPLALA
ncbi:MAG: PilZ domain-containing protein [bacterium]